MSVTGLPTSRRHQGSPRTVRLRRVSWRVRPRVVGVGVSATAAVVALMAWTMTLGDFPVPFGELIATTFGLGSGEHDFVVRTLRLPRTLAAALVGVALGASGAIFQGLVRNPLVAPDIIGIMSGASLVAVATIVLGLSSAMLPVGAFLGAVSAAALIYLLSWRGGITGGRLVLIGIGVNAALAAGTTFMIVRFPVERASSAVLWQAGTLYGRTWGHVVWITASLVILLPAAGWLMRHLRTLQLGDDAAAALGLHTEPARAGLLVVGSGLAAIAVAVAGPVGFVALMVPHIARMLVGPLTGGVLVVAGLLGAALVLASDLVAQHLFSPTSLPVGVVTAAVGAPYFLFLLYRTNRSAT